METNEVQIGGHSLVTESRIILKGNLDNFRLKGTIAFHPSNIPVSIVDL